MSWEDRARELETQVQDSKLKQERAEFLYSKTKQEYSELKRLVAELLPVVEEVPRVIWNDFALQNWIQRAKNAVQGASN